MSAEDVSLKERMPKAASVASGEEAAQTLQTDEFYFEGPYMVFTEAYHRRRGYCCNSDCRHCPYR